MKVLLEGTALGPRLMMVPDSRPFIHLPVRRPFRLSLTPPEPQRSTIDYLEDTFQRTNELDPATADVIYRQIDK